MATYTIKIEMDQKAASELTFKHTPATDAEIGQTPPSGKQFINVSANAINGTGSLTGGTGTSLNNIFSCGTFDANNLPQIDNLYTIKATDSQDGTLYQFGAKCVHSGANSDFKYL
ncbi:hypothetical protein [Dapis sp. BLCC M172]|uniref:hypothetical protein n=1 Tax=Dapis sp. BLCC M172 TaxID=2975281 RepID=UPI003CF3F63F